MRYSSSNRLVEFGLAIVLASAGFAAEPSADPALMNKGTVRALFDMKLSQEQADALTPVIRQAVDEIRDMLRAEVQRAHALPDQDGMMRKARVMFDQHDASADAILDDAQWSAYMRFKRYAVQRICGAGFDVFGKEDGPGVKLWVVPKPIAAVSDPAPTNSGAPRAAPPTDR